MSKVTSAVLLLVSAFASACATMGKSQSTPREAYSPRSRELHEAIARADGEFFGAYNTCDVDTLSSFVADDLELYHDVGGLVTSGKTFVGLYKDNICGHVTRELKEGSLEVYPIANYGAVELGAHRFRDTREDGGTPGRYSKFILIWRNTQGAWKLTRMVSLH